MESDGSICREEGDGKKTRIKKRNIRKIGGNQRGRHKDNNGRGF